jgi:RNA polymerase sigma-54 factor
MPDELPLDSSWSDTYRQLFPADGYSRALRVRRQLAMPAMNYDPFAQQSRPQTLHDHLAWQLNLTKLGPRDRAVAEALIDAIDANGYLRLELEELLEILGDDELELDEIEAVLHRIQSFDPPGVGARTRANACCCSCVSCRLTNPSATTPSGSANHTLRPCRATTSTTCAGVPGWTRTTLRQALALLRSMHPRPGALVADIQPRVRVPDVIVRRHNGEWHGRAEFRKQRLD